MAKFSIKKMEVLLILPLYLKLFFVWWGFWRVIKATADVKNILNDDDFFGDIVDTPMEGIEQHRKRECLKRKWTQEKVDKASDETINKTYAEYKQRELNEKGEIPAKALGKHVINLCSSGIYRIVKIRDVKNLRGDINNDPIIKDQMANLGCLLVCTFGDYLVPILVAVHTVNNLGPGDELENGGYEND